MRSRVVWLAVAWRQWQVTPSGGRPFDLGMDIRDGLRRGDRQSQVAGELVASSDVNRNSVDFASGMRHLMVLLAVGVDEALRVDPDPVLAVTRTSTDDILTWGMECPDCIYLRATLRGGAVPSTLRSSSPRA